MLHLEDTVCMSRLRGLKQCQHSKHLPETQISPAKLNGNLRTLHQLFIPVAKSKQHLQLSVGVWNNPPTQSFLQQTTDIDECEMDPTLCEQICNNTVGSYECKCEDGYQLVAGADQCAGNMDCRLVPHQQLLSWHL